MSDQRHALGRDAQARLEELLSSADGSLGKATMVAIVNAFEAPELAGKSLGFVSFELMSDAAVEGINLDQDDLVAFGRFIRHLKSQKRSKRRVRAAAHGRKVRCLRASVRERTQACASARSSVRKRALVRADCFSL